MPNQGMLGGLFSPNFRNLRDEELDENRRLDALAADPFRAMARTAYEGAGIAGRGLGTAVAGAAGKDPRTPTARNAQAVEAAKAEVAKLGFDPEDPKSLDSFYKQVISILQKQGLVAEAMEVAQEWRKAKQGDEKHALDLARERRMTQRDADVNARAAERNEVLAKRGMKDPETLQLLAELDRTPADQAAKRKAILARLNFLSTRAGKGVKFEDLGDSVAVVDAETGDVLRIDEKGLNPLQGKKDEDKTGAAADAYAEYMAGLQRQYNAAVELYNHRGVEGITGRWGRWVGEPGAFAQFATTFSSDDAGAALALYKQVTGGTFLAGLAKLKSASKTGATGLGAVSEREGDKVQSDAAALDRLQQPVDFRKQLGTYISEIEGFGSRLTAAAQADGIKPHPLAAKPLAAPGKRPAAPAIAPKTAPGPVVQGDRVRVQLPDGQTGTIPRSKLPEAKARGAVEIK